MTFDGFLRRAIYVLVFFTLGLGVASVVGFIFTLQQLERLQAKADKLKSEVATYVSAKAVSQMTIGDAISVIAQNDADLDALCRSIDAITGRQTEAVRSSPAYSDLLTASHNDCPETKGSHIGATRAFLNSYLQGVDARLREDWADAAVHYEQAIAVPGMDDQPAWVVRGLEGDAYAKMQQGDFAGSQADLARAKPLAESLKAGNVFYEITSIKLMCRQHEPPSRVSDALAAARARLNKLVSDSSSTADDKHYAQLDLSSLDGDDELFEFCAYAKLDGA